MFLSGVKENLFSKKITNSDFGLIFPKLFLSVSVAFSC